MEWLLALVIGILVGALCTYLVVQMRTWWKKSNDLRASAEKARKERKDREVKARQDAEKARGAFWQAILRVMLLVFAIIVTSLVIWMVVVQS